MIYVRKYHLEMDENWGNPHFRKPPYMGLVEVGYPKVDVIHIDVPVKIAMICISFRQTHVFGMMVNVR